MGAIDWKEWDAAAFGQARDEGRPVLLSIVTAWCRHCAEMDRTSYADPAVVELVARRFVPIRVDAERRPDISSRYLLGGWPTTAFLTPDGEVLGGGTYVAAGRLPGVLRQVDDAFRARAFEGVAPAVFEGDPRPPSPPAGPPAGEAAGAAGARAFATFDRDLGTFGGGFPHVAPIRLAMDDFRRNRAEDARALAITALDALGWGGLYDAAGGGFFRCAAGPGWTNPAREKLLDVNAALLSLYVEAFETFQLSRYGERASDVVRFVQAELADARAGGWAASVVDGAVDPTVYTDWNGTAASAMLQAARVFEDEGLRDFAIRSLERVVLQSYRPGAGVAHYVDGAAQARGLLDDQVAMIHAHLDAHALTGDIVYEMMAEELGHFVLRTLQDDRAGGLFDRSIAGSDVGRLRRRLKPFVGNCEAAAALGRLAAASGETPFLDAARRALAAVAAAAPAHGPQAACHPLALRAIERG